MHEIPGRIFVLRTMSNSTERFANRVANYVKYRPSYPREFVDHLIRIEALKPDYVVADIGSGTGLSALPLIEQGNHVYCVEPNEPMRIAGEEYLQQYKNFTSIDGTAEHTTLEDDSVDLIVAGQAFHWFDRITTRREFERILRPEGMVLLMWNERLIDASPFLHEYEQFLLTHGTDYSEINHVHVTPDVIERFFEPNEVMTHEFENIQTVDYDGLEGRVMSCSYVPNYGDTGHAELIDALRELHKLHAVDGKVDFIYMTKMFYGKLA